MNIWPFSEPVRKDKVGKQSFWGTVQRSVLSRGSNWFILGHNLLPFLQCEDQWRLHNTAIHCILNYSSEEQPPHAFGSINVMTCGLQVIIHIQQAASELSKKRYTLYIYIYIYIHTYTKRKTEREPVVGIA
jgi:hypothetical protein